MKKQVPLPQDEGQRLEVLNEYHILNSLPESDFDDITRIAAEICRTPIALISLIDADRQWFKSHHGLAISETPREYSFCAHAIVKPEEIMIVPDSTKDERFADNPLVTGDPHVVFYAGAPLLAPNGVSLGTLCVIDEVPRTLNAQQINALKSLANQVVAQLELRKKIREMEDVSLRMEKANQALNRFAYSCSHDMKAPLANITLLTKMLKDNYHTKLDVSGQKCVDHIQTSAEKLNHMIEGILYYSRIPEVVLHNKTQVNIPEVLQEISELVIIPDNVSIQYPQNLPVIKTSKIAFEQILQNLISNAIKYNDKPQGLIQISMEESKDYWKFCVKDNGPGIALKDQEKVFEVFQTLGRKDRNGKVGSGIGLATVKLLVEELEGQISLSSAEDMGCQFKFTLKK